jgi:succinylglutamate desuccinylase
MIPFFVKFVTGSPRSAKDEESVITKETDVASLSPTFDDSESLVSMLSDTHVACTSSAPVVFKSGDKKSRFADHARHGLRYLKKDDSNVVMLFERPSSANDESSFDNCQVYRFHDYDPPASNAYTNRLGPCRDSLMYSLMNG